MLASCTILSQTRLEETADLTSFLSQAGFLHQECSGVLSLSSLGSLALEHLEQRLHAAVQAAGAARWRLSSLQTQDCWDRTGRAQDYGEELMSVKLRSGQVMRLSATAEEQVTSLVARNLSGRRVDHHVYQLGTKWRDEIRARGGLLRGREFRMMDAYHFCMDEASMHAGNERMRNALVEFLVGLGCQVRVVAADCGEIGGLSSEEIQVRTDLDDSGWMEVGHCFALGQRYARAFDFKTSSGDHAWMSCQGLGTTRLLAVLLGNRRDGRRLWGDAGFCVFDDVVVAIGKDEATMARARALHDQMQTQGRRVVLDDRFQRAGQQLTSSEALGARRRWVVSDRLGQRAVELTELANGKTQVLEEENWRQAAQKVV